MNWKFVGGISSLLVATALILFGASFITQLDRQARLMRETGQNVLRPLATGFGSIAGLPKDPELHCITLPTGIRLASQPTSREWMDHRYRQFSDWTAISNRMKPGDDVYAYGNIIHPPSGVTVFTGLGGGYVVLRGWCLIGEFGTWIE
jgi:hypothetical protein